MASARFVQCVLSEPSSHAPPIPFPSHAFPQPPIPFPSQPLPPSMSDAARDLLQSLLRTAPEARPDWPSVKAHPWFDSISFQDLEAGRVTPPTPPPSQMACSSPSASSSPRPLSQILRWLASREEGPPLSPAVDTLLFGDF